MDDPRSHIPALDGLRGLAILLVVLHHQFTYPIASPHVESVGRVVFGFWIGVDLFFVLSGFLITTRLLQAVGTRNPFRDFYVRRVLRIFPLYYLAVLVIAFVVPMIAGPSRASAARWYLATYSQNVPSLWSTTGTALGQPGFAHFWSLCVEEHFYLLWPLLVIRHPRQLLWACAATAAFAIGFRAWCLHVDKPWAAYTFTASRIDSLAAGAAVAGLRERLGGQVLRRWALAALLPAAAALAVLWALTGMQMWQRPFVTYGYPVVWLCCALVLILAMASQAWLRQLLTLRPLTWLGRYSYGLYVVHWILIPWICAGPIRGFIANHLANRDLAMASYLVVTFALFCGIAWPLYHFWEKPFLALKERFAATRP